MKFLINAGVVALLTIGCVAEKGLRATGVADEISAQSKKLLEVDVSSDHVDMYEADRCTSIIVGAKAGSEGPMTTHTADCMNCDFRLAKVVINPHSVIVTHFSNRIRLFLCFAFPT